MQVGNPLKSDTVRSRTLCLGRNAAVICPFPFLFAADRAIVGAWEAAFANIMRALSRAFCCRTDVIAASAVTRALAAWGRAALGILGRVSLGILGRVSLATWGREAVATWGPEAAATWGREALAAWVGEALATWGREALATWGRAALTASGRAPAASA
jgi:hypothetical protein